MYVIGHHTPGVQVVALPGEMEQRILDNLSALRISQITSPVPLIQILLDQELLLPLGGAFGQYAQILFPFLDYFHW